MAHHGHTHSHGDDHDHEMEMENEEELEAAHFSNVVATFRGYRAYSLSANGRRLKDFYGLSAEDQALLTELGYRRKIDVVDEKIEQNADFLRRVVGSPEIFSNTELGEGDREDEDEGNEGGDGDDGENGGGGEVPAADMSQHSSAQGPHQHGHPSEHQPAHGHAHGHSHTHSHDHPYDRIRRRRAPYQPSEFDIDKLRSTLKQLVRDWSAEGKAERDACYQPILEALVDHFREIPEDQRGNIRVLVPGAGLARLAYDVVLRGFACQGNEFSHYMLLSSFYILNRTERINQHTIYPYIHSFSNLPSTDALLKGIQIPDILPSTLPPGSNFSLVAGDFEEIYGSEEGVEGREPQAGLWNAVLTCFFIDTAKNVVNYLRIIHRVLAPGGIWINLGPLLWHYENSSEGDPSIELSLDEVKELARKIGFEIREERRIDTTYTGNVEGMLAYVYRTAFWTAIKI
ncbi:hypothetical protein BOTBODRAFT_39554 [Botryobasidium botryosum FD-172 SS1]|uniref:carnosine N-methyltransferase n=1 Tax=Botryobasidium botryosum (strain FD-172 SS1) TaxID=930990 RepID=A0A067LTU2_BOTB1|nr:hypothetical protein BOTBODRAFT_39554 [Botryobasidium botryosum FD-172 SS1]